MREALSSRRRDSRLSRAIFGAIVAGGLLPVAAHAQDISHLSGGGASYDWDANTPVSGQNHMQTSVPGPVFGGANVAPIIGADTFYSHGFTGGATITYNVEGGHIWQGHETLGHVTVRTNLAGVPAAPYVTPAFDRHATWVGMMIGGRPSAVAPDAGLQSGIASQTDLRSGAIATNWNGNAYALGFGASIASLTFPYAAAFGTADTINSSWGATSVSGSPEASGTDVRCLLIDGMANASPRTTFVASAGNDGTSGNPMVGAPGSGYNGITVGALQNDGANNYNTVATFSSRGPSDYADPTHGTTLAATARRATVDVVAPGTSLTSAFYGGQSGGNDPQQPGSAASGGPTSYSGGLNGTSFAAPITAASVTLMHQAAAGLALPADAEDTRVIKANLMNAARKIPGWSNGQVAHPNGNGGVRTTDALDMTSGAGAIDMNRTYTQFTQGQTDILGTVGGVTPQTIGWDYGIANLGGNNDVVITTPMTGELRVTLSWFRERSTNTTTFATSDIGFANLDLQVWNSTFTTLISESLSSFSETEHLTFNLPNNGLYGLRVAYPNNAFGNLTSEEYGLAWYGTAVPEPTTFGLALVPMLAMGLRRRRRQV